MSASKHVFFLLLVVLLPIAIAAYLAFPPAVSVSGAAQPPCPVLILDAGHGGEDGGAISLSGIKESNLNLAIATRIDLILGIVGTPVSLLRQQDVSLHSPQSKTLREKKVSDLKNRVELVNQQAGGVLLSVHQNSFPDGTYHGAQVFYAPTAGSQALACAMQEMLRSAVDPSNSRQAAAIQKSVYLMNHVTSPAVLVECGFLTNPEEEQRLQDFGYQTKLATAMAGCWLKYRFEFSFLDRDEGIN